VSSTILHYDQTEVAAAAVAAATRSASDDDAAHGYDARWRRSNGSRGDIDGAAANLRDD
jgi:hypothetical protein